MVLSFVVVDFVNWDGRVNNTWLNSLALDDWLNGLMDVVVNVLSSNGWVDRSSMLGLSGFASILELSSLGLKSLLHVIVVAVVDLLVLNTGDVMLMLFWENLLVLHWLDRSMVMILVDFAVNCSGSLLMSGPGNMFVGNGWVDSLMDSGIMLSVLGEETGNCCLCLIHFA